MNRYQTFTAKVEMSSPRQMHGMKYMEIVEYMREHHKENVKWENDIPVCTPANKCTAYLKAVSKAIFDPSDWKNPIYVQMPNIPREWVKAAIVWYHGDDPIEVYGGVYGNGYQCW